MIMDLIDKVPLGHIWVCPCLIVALSPVTASLHVTDDTTHSLPVAVLSAEVITSTFIKNSKKTEDDTYLFSSGLLQSLIFIFMDYQKILHLPFIINKIQNEFYQYQKSSRVCFNFAICNILSKYGAACSAGTD